MFIVKQSSFNLTILMRAYNNVNMSTLIVYGDKAAKVPQNHT